MNIVDVVKSRRSIETIRTILEHYGVNRLHVFGNTIRCSCPIHGGNNPTSFVWKENGLWYCHTQCNEGGDEFSFVARMEGLNLETNFKDVANKVAEILSIDVSTLTYDNVTRQNNREFDLWKRSIKNKQAIVNSEEFNLARLGELQKISRYRGISAETLELFEVCYSAEHDRIVFPIRDEANRCVGATMRRRDNNNPIKWLHQPTGVKVGDFLYGLHLATGDIPFLVEGAIDVLRLRDLGIFALGCFGAKLTDEQAKTLIRNYTSINIMYDGDKAGMDATKMALDKLKGKMDITIYVLPWGVDPGAITEHTWEDVKIYKAYEFEKVYKNMEQCV